MPFLKWALESKRLTYIPEMVALLLAATATLPIWVVTRPPLQDFPQHVAAVRVLSSYFDPSFRFTEYFELTLGRTQYLTVYLVAAALAKVSSPLIATKTVLSASLIALPYTLTRLLRALGRSPWLALLSLPLLFNVHVAFGFLNFVAAIPLLLWGLELACRQFRAPSLRLGILLACVLVFTFFTHVVPFGILFCGVALLTPLSRRTVTTNALILTPSLLVALAWLFGSPAGRVVAALGSSHPNGDASSSYQTFGAALRSLPDFMLDVASTDADDARLVFWSLLVLVLLVLTVVAPREADRKLVTADSGRNAVVAEADAVTKRSTDWPRLVVGMIVPASLLAYVTLPTANGFIWPISQRFPLIGALFLVPLLGRSTATVRALAVGCSIVLSAQGTVEYASLFREIEARAYRGFDDTIARIPRGSRVATLVFDRNLEGLRLSPLMHAAGWVQADRGGLVMFTFAEFPSSPFSYRESHRPPPVPPRWEWVPERVQPDRDLSWYDFVLVHGWDGTLQTAHRFRRVFAEGRWSLWQKVDTSPPSR
jgi:hypothetical protein